MKSSKSNPKGARSKQTPLICSLKVVILASFILTLFACSKNNDSSITISGRIEADEINLSFKYPGKIEEINFKEGDLIEKGKIIAKIKSDDLKAQLNRAILEEKASSTIIETKILQQQSLSNRLEQLKLKKEILQDSIRNEIQISENNLKNAEHKLKIDKSNNEKAKANYEKIKNDHQRFLSLYEQNAIPKQKFDEIDTLLKIAQEDLALAQESLKISEQNYRSAHNTLSIAKARLKEVDAIDREIKAAEKELSIVKKESEITSINKQKTKEFTNEIESHLEDTLLKAPMDIIITKKLSQLGEIVAAGQPIAVGYSPKEIHFRGFIPEPLIGKIKLNMEGKLKTDSYPNRTLNGKIIFINNRSEFTPKEVQTPQERVKQVFLIKAKIDDTENILKPGMPADFIINLK